MSRVNDLLSQLHQERAEFSRIGDIASIGTGKKDRKDATIDGIYPFFVRSKDVLRINTYEYDEEAIVIPGEGRIGEIFHHVSGKYALHQRAYRISFHQKKVVDTRFAYYYFSANFKKFILSRAVSATVTSIRKPMITEFRIPILTLAVQTEIVRILDAFSKLEAELEAELEARRLQYEHYRDVLLSFDAGKAASNYSAYALGELLDYEQPSKYLVKSVAYENEFATPVVTPGKTFILGYTDETDGIYPASSHKPVIIFDDFTSATQWVDFPFKAKSSAMKILTTKAKDPYLLRYIYHVIQTINYAPQNHARQYISTYSTFRIPVPRTRVLKNIVSDLDKFDTLVNDLYAGLPAEINARQQQYRYYRDRLMKFKEAA